MELGLDGRVAVVTGASRGIGLEIVRALRAEGADVLAAARTALTENGVRTLAADLTTPTSPSVPARSTSWSTTSVAWNRTACAPAASSTFQTTPGCGRSS